jgi:hypothetical protein
MMQPNSLDEEYNRFLQRAFQNGPKAPRTFDAAAIERILEKIGSQHWREALDREALAQELERAVHRFKFWRPLDQGPTNKQKKADVKQLRSSIQRLRKALPSPDDLLFAFLCNTDHRIDAWHAVFANLPELEKAAKEALDCITNDGPSPMDTAYRFLIYVELPEIIGRYFTCQRRGISRSPNSNEPGGPALVFIKEVLSIAGIRNSKEKPFTPTGIEHYLRDR